MTAETKRKAFEILQQWRNSHYDSTRLNRPRWESLFDRVFRWRKLRDASVFAGGMASSVEMWKAMHGTQEKK